MTIAQLNTEFSIDGRLKVIAGDGGLPMIKVTGEHARAKISVYAGQVLSFQPTGQNADLLFVSPSAYYAPGKAIKGGVPICWPWFGPDPDGKGRPGHGFVRNRAWDLRATAQHADGTIEVCLGLTDSDETRAIWDHGFDLELKITIGATLGVALTTRNTGTKAFVLSQGLHTYLAVGDIAKVKILGLDDRTYIDKMDEGHKKVQQGAVIIREETDRVYVGVKGPLSVEDAALKRRITITPHGSASAVVWNPWAATAAAMADLGDDDYKRLVCVETTNAGPDEVSVAPGREHELVATYALSAL